jgi:hypothetical protein
MASVTDPGYTLPVAGDDLDAEPVTGWITALKTFVEGQNIDANNVNSSATNGIMVKSVAQTVTGLKSLENTGVAGSGVLTALEVGTNPASGTAVTGDGALILFYADDDGGNKTTLGTLRAVWVTPTDGATEASNLELTARIAGAVVEMLSMGTDGLIWNETGLALSARFEGDTNANLLYLDGTNDRVGIGTASPSVLLDVNGAISVLGTYSAPLRIGAVRLWHDTNNDILRVKTSAPASATDGQGVQLYDLLASSPM